MCGRSGTLASMHCAEDVNSPGSELLGLRRYASTVRLSFDTPRVVSQVAQPG